MTDTPPSADDIDRSTAPRNGLTEWISANRVGAVAIVMSAVALVLSAAPMMTGGDFGGRVRAYLMANPQVLDEVLAERQVREASDRIAAMNTAAAANPGLLAADPRDPSFGPEDARVVVTEFFDYRCPYCKAASVDYLKVVQANPDVRFVFKEWPILDQGDDNTSQLAARAALAAQKQGRYLAVHQGLMAENSLDIGAIQDVLRANGVNMIQAASDITAPETSRHLADIHTSAAALSLNGTPTFFINGRASPSNDPAQIAQAIAAARRG